MAKKKKRGKKTSGHYCRICGKHKPNEKFSGKGHAKHICKECDTLPQERKNELQYINQIDQAAWKYPRSKQDWELLERFAKNKKYPEAMEYAQSILDTNRDQQFEEEIDWEEDDFDIEELILDSLNFSELEDDLKEDISFELYEVIENFILRKEYIPEEKDKQNILNEICIDIAHGYGYTLDILLDKELNTLFEKALKDVIESLKEEGFNPLSYNESLIVLKTERLFVRKFAKDDLAALHSILEKPEVMYAWEHGFTKSETRKWLNKQLTRYKKDSYGYFAVILKETNKLIGQVGLMKSEINGQEVVELGYIFDNLYWGNGYCIESVKNCVQFAFDNLELDELYCSIRPNNFSSIHIAEKIGMSKIGEHVVNYRGKEMPHIVYVLRKV